MSVDATFAATLSALVPDEDHPVLGVAVSGGGDSTALLHLASGWARSRGFAIQAVTVNHGLRPEAALEAAGVARQCKALGVSHDILGWPEPAKTGNLQDAARQARRRLIADWADARGIDTVLLGHTADDQAETVLMRLARGSGVDGLAGMAQDHCAAGISWIRPLLDQRRADLRDWLNDHKISWIEDPSNDDLRFDRVKARAMMGHLAGLGLTVDRLLRTAEHMQLAQVSLRAAAAGFARTEVRQIDGDLVLSPLVFNLDAGDSPGRVLAAALSWMNGSDYRPRYDALVGLAEKVRAGQRATLAGSIAQPQPDGSCRLIRELSAASAETYVSVGVISGVSWDHRWFVAPTPLKPSWLAGRKRIEYPSIPAGLRIGALGETGLLACPDWRASGIPRASLLSSPAVWQGDTLIAAPLAGFNDAWQARIVADFHSCLLSH